MRATIPGQAVAPPLVGGKERCRGRFTSSMQEKALRRKFWLGVVTLAALMLALAGVALAHPEHDGGTDAEDGAHDLHQHGDGAGHLPATSENVDVVSKLRLDHVVPEKKIGRASG